MALPAKHWLDALDALNGAPKVSHPHGGIAYPTVERTFYSPRGQETQQPATLADYPGTVLVQLEEVSRDGLRVKLYVRYETLPGPWIYSTRLDEDGEIVTVATRRNKTADIVSTEGVDSGVWTKVSKQGGDVNAAQEVSESRYVPARQVMNSATVTTQGTGYGSNQLITLTSGASEIPAILRVGYVSLVGITITAGGAGYLVGDLFVFSGVGFVQAQAVVSSVGLAGTITGLTITVSGSFTGGGALSFDGASSFNGSGADLLGIYGVSSVTVERGGRYAAAQAGLNQASVSPAGGTGAIFTSTVAPAPVVSDPLDEDGVTLAQSKTFATKAAFDAIAMSDRDKVTSGVWTQITFEPANPGDQVGWQTNATRAVPGPYLYRTVNHPLLGFIQTRKRLVENTGQPTSQTATTKVFYNERPGSHAVFWEIAETSSDGSGSAGNPLYPVLVDDTDDPANGPTQKVTQLVRRTGLEVGSRAVIANGITLATIAAAGSNYTSPPACSISGAGTGATAVARISDAGAVVAVIITNPGSGYTGTPTIAFSGGAGTGAAATLTVGASLFRKIEFNDLEENPDLLKREVTTYALPSTARLGSKITEWGAAATSAQTVVGGTAAATGPLVLESAVTPTDDSVSQSESGTLPNLDTVHFGTEIESSTDILFNVAEKLVANGTRGGVDAPSAKTITGATAATQTVVTLNNVTGLTAGMGVTCAGTGTTPSLDGAHLIVALSGNTATLDFAVTVGASGGTLTLSAPVYRRVQPKNDRQATQLATQVDTASRTNFYRKYKGRISINFPPVLQFLNCNYNYERGDGVHSETGTASSIGSEMSVALSGTGSAQGSAAVLPYVDDDVRDVWGQDLPCDHYFFWLPAGFTEADALARLTTLAGVTVLAWPVFKPTAISLLLRTRKVSGRAEASAKTSHGKTSTREDVAFSKGTGVSFDVSVGVQNIRIPPTLHAAMTYPPADRSQPFTCTARVNLSATGGIVVPQDTGTVDASGAAVGGFSFSASLFTATTPAALPASGLYLHTFDVGPGRDGQMLCRAVVFDFSVL